MVAAWIGAEQVVDTHGTDDHDPTGLASLADLLDSLERPAWHTDAACSGKPMEWWFPDRGESVDPAKEVCASCPVIDECADFAVTQGVHLVGIWAGETARGRRKRRRTARELDIVA